MPTSVAGTSSKKRKVDPVVDLYEFCAENASGAEQLKVLLSIQNLLL